MFPRRMFPERMFAPTYFPQSQGNAPTVSGGLIDITSITLITRID